MKIKTSRGLGPIVIVAGLALAACRSAPVPLPDSVGVTDYSGRIRASIDAMLKGNDWIIVSEQTGAIRARSPKDTTPVELVVEYDEDRINFRYASGLTGSPDELPPAGAATYGKPRGEGFSEVINDRCADIAGYLRKSSYPLPVDIGCDSDVIPLTGATSLDKVHEAVRVALLDHEWAITSEGEGVVFASQPLNNGSEVRIRASYEPTRITYAYVSGVVEFRYPGPNGEKRDEKHFVGGHRFRQWMDNLDQKTREFLDSP